LATVKPICFKSRDGLTIHGYLTFTPDIFACGVDVFGIFNLIAFTQSVLKYWKNWKPYWYKYAGNPDDPEDRYQLLNLNSWQLSKP